MIVDIVQHCVCQSDKNVKKMLFLQCGVLTGPPFSPAGPGGPWGPERPGRPVGPAGPAGPRSPGEPYSSTTHCVISELVASYRNKTSLISKTSNTGN